LANTLPLLIDIIAHFPYQFLALPLSQIGFNGPPTGGLQPEEKFPKVLNPAVDDTKNQKFFGS
jgi:hypothetical protein